MTAVAAAAIVLAAGEASRFGSPKQRLLVPAVLRRLAESPVDEAVVVQGAYPLELPALPGPPGFARLVECPDWPRGPGASLRCGLAALGPAPEVAVVVLADGPRISPDAVARVLAAWREERGVVAASYGGARGHPLAVGRELWDDIPDEGLHARPVLLVSCDDLGAPGDVDTPADLPDDLRPV